MKPSCIGQAGIGPKEWTHFLYLGNGSEINIQRCAEMRLKSCVDIMTKQE